MFPILPQSPMQSMAERALVLGFDPRVEVTHDDARAVASCTSDAT